MTISFTMSKPILSAFFHFSLCGVAACITQREKGCCNLQDGVPAVHLQIGKKGIRKEGLGMSPTWELVHCHRKNAHCSGRKAAEETEKAFTQFRGSRQVLRFPNPKALALLSKNEPGLSLTL